MLDEGKELLGKPLAAADGKKLQVTDEMLILDLRGIRDRVRAIAEEQKTRRCAPTCWRSCRSRATASRKPRREEKLVNRRVARRRVADRRARDGQGLRLDQAPDLVGDKMAGRHGNKGSSRRSCGRGHAVPRRRHAGRHRAQIRWRAQPHERRPDPRDAHRLGAKKLGWQVVSPVFDGASEQDIEAALEKAGFAKDGKSVLYDGRTGEAFTQRVTVGSLYMLKLHTWSTTRCTRAPPDRTR